MSSNYPHSNSADKYARDCVSGKILVNKWVKLACKKHLQMLKAQKRDDYAYYYDSEAAEKACKFVELMPHTKGKWAREKKLLTLEPWQKFFVCSIFGWKRKKDGLRLYRRALLWVPRKNGKSALAAAIGLYMFVADGEFGSEVYSGATTEKQAWEVFRPAKLMAKRQEEFREYYDINVNASNMNVEDDESRFEPLIGNPGDGASPHCAIIDEYHEHDTDRLVDTMETGMGAREHPLLLMITTAGDNIAGPCYQMQMTSEKILDELIEEPSTFALIYGIDEDDDWKDPKSLRKANPNFGISVSEDYLLTQLQRAMNDPRKQSTFKTKHLNVWVGSRNAYYNVEKWKACSQDINIEQYFGKQCYIGMDLASRDDIASVVILIPDGLKDGKPHYAMFSKNYLPEDKAFSVEYYTTWAKMDLLELTDGEIIDFNEIKDDILELCSNFEVKELAYDPFQATMLVSELMEEGVPVIEMRATHLNFSEPMKEIDALSRTKRITHNGDPVFNWMISNVTAKPDKKDNVYPTKEVPENKIDGPVALMMALNRAMEADDLSIEKAINNPLKATL